MGQALSKWTADVQRIAADATGLEIDDTDAASVGVEPAIAQYSIDRPRRVTVEVAGTGTSYIALPSSGDGWISGFSWIERIEYPARRNPPVYLDSQLWEMGHLDTDVTAERIVLHNSTPSSSEYLRLLFSTSWPIPDGTPSTDQLDQIAYHAVTHLAASMCLGQVAAEHGRSMAGAVASAFTDGVGQAQQLRESAKMLRSVYDTYLGRATADGSGGGAQRPASRAMDFDPGEFSLFHGGRR